MAGPFDNEGKAGLDRAFGPESELGDPLVMGRTYEGKERAVTNRTTPDVFPYGWVDLGAMVRPAEKVCAYATTFVRDPRAKNGARPFAIWFGSAGASKVFFDGVEVLKDTKYRDLDADRHGVTLTMREGWHRLTVKVCGDDDPPMFSLRLAAPDGSPDATLESDADPNHGREAAAAKFKKGEKPPAPVVGGPVAAFEKMIARDDAASLEAYARWMVLSSSDDPAEHRARDLARRSAEKAPTVPRCVLAGDLAENRNQRAIWIDKAEDVVKRGVSLEDRVQALLARAGHARGGANWRDAIPYYDKVLALDPDNVPANLARVELYSEAGLRETALASLDRVLARRPRSVALLRANTAALRDMDRVTEAEELVSRYATMRFDDSSVMNDRIELALARRDPASAARWIDRLIETRGKSIREIARSLAIFSAFNEGVNLFSSFAVLLNFSRFNKLKGVGQIIAFSIKDESLHSDAGCWLFRTLVSEYPDAWDDELREEIYDAARMTVELEDAFIDKAFSEGPIEGLELADLKAFIRFRCNTKLNDLGLKKLWKKIDKEALERMAWFDVLSAGVGHNDFFASRVDAYSKGTIDFTKIWE